jgi:predicted TIM-barrel fold metal-dependent hydrolase
MIIDAHTHLFPPDTDKVGTAEMLLAEMDGCGVDKAVVLSIYPRISNEFIAGQVRAHPDRFIGFTSVNPNDGQAALDLLDRCVREYAARGLKLHPTMQHFWADDTALLAPLMYKVEALDMPVLMHSWGWFGEDCEAAPSRIMTLARTFPAVTFIMAHCGGMRFMDLLPLARLRQLGQLTICTLTWRSSCLTWRTPRCGPSCGGPSRASVGIVCFWDPTSPTIPCPIHCVWPTVWSWVNKS